MALIASPSTQDLRRAAPVIAMAVAVVAGASAVLVPETTMLLVVVALAGVVATQIRSAGVSILAGALAYVVAVEWAYAEHISSLYVWSGFVYMPPRWIDLAIVLLMAWLPALVMPKALRLMSQAVVWAMYAIVYVPSILVTFHVHGVRSELHLTLFGAMVLLAIGQRIPRSAAISVGFDSRWHRAVVAVLGVAGIVFIAIRFGISFDLPNPQDVTDTRTDYKAARDPGSFTAYAIPWLGRAVFPFLLILGLRDRRWVLVVIAAIGSMMVYSTAGFRSSLFVPFLVVAAYLLVRRGQDARIIPWALAAVVFVSGWLATLGLTSALSLLVRRPIMLPGQLTGYYFDYFSDHPQYQLRHSVLSFIGSPPYDSGQTAADLIGETYLNGGHANANVWADAMANFGLIGVFVFTMLLVIGLWVADRLTMHHVPAVLVTIGAIAGFTFSNTGLLTGSFSAGVGALVLLALIGRSGSQPVPVEAALAADPMPPGLQHPSAEPSVEGR
jgi:hypothetical protein